jgi:DNA-binding transcriptional LysR family regulator
MHFDLTDLRLFLAVVDAGSITHGAAEAGLSLSAASERLSDMEATGEVVLLHRGRRGVTPTEAGEALAHHARIILHQMARMRGELGQHAKGLRVTVRVLANTAAITEFLPDRLAPWMAAHPHVDVELKERQSTDIGRNIAAGFAEIGILSSTSETVGLTLLPFAIDRLVAVSAQGYGLIEKPHLRFADLLDQYFVGLTDGALQRHIEMQAARLGTKLKIRVTLRSFEGICRLAAEGVGIGIVPESAARRAKQSAHIAIAQLQDDWATRQLSVGVRSVEALTPPAKTLFQHLTSNASL